MELRKEDLSAMESICPVQKQTKKKEYVAPLLDLYSMMVDDGRCNTMHVSYLFICASNEDI
jgi:phage I-like protein